MAVDISAQVTSVWPATETILLADAADAAPAGVDYATQKDLAMARAKRALYGGATVPSETDIPEVAAYWIADQAVVYLIPLAKDYYQLKRRVSDAKENATITYYNLITNLNKLKSELEAALAAGKQAALDAISSAEVEDDVPAVSVAGLAVDPLARAMGRGPW